MSALGAGVLAYLLAFSPKSESGIIFGYSLFRLAIFALTFSGVIVLAVCAFSAWHQPAWWRRLSRATADFAAHPARLFGLTTILVTLFLGLAAILIVGISTASRELVILRSLLERAGLVLVWIELDILLFGLLGWVNLLRRQEWQPFFTRLRLAILFAIATGIYTLTLKIYTTAVWDTRFVRLAGYIFLPAVLFLAWGLAERFFSKTTRYEQVSRLFLLASIGVVTFVVYRHMSQWMDWQVTPSKAYWHLLADAFLKGRLYLIDPPTTHDLTLFNGQWYVPNPPLPGLVLAPIVALTGVDGFNSVTFSIILGALNAVLLYLILERASWLKLIPTGQSANLWIVGLFAVGTVHWWLATMGRMWFISQLLTLLCAALAVLAVLYRRPAWLAGLGLGLAVLARPNVFTLWPLLLGLLIYIHQRERGKIDLRRIFSWSALSAAPVVLAAFGLLYYNHIRFGDWLDFGYTTVNGAERLVEAVQKYGMFNVHFIVANLRAMFLRLPTVSLEQGCLMLNQGQDGTAVLVMTPALIYVFRRFRWNWWTAGAWLSVLLTAGLLLFYHNYGAAQLGYRYLLDFILPLMLLLAVGVGSKPSWIFKTLVFISAAANFLGMLWWFNRWWC